jgi:pyruvate dehydrogenase E1 component
MRASGEDTDDLSPEAARCRPWLRVPHWPAIWRATIGHKRHAGLRKWIDRCPNDEYAALTFQGGAIWRKRLMDDLWYQGAVSALIDAKSDAELADLMENPGGELRRDDGRDVRRDRP